MFFVLSRLLIISPSFTDKAKKDQLLGLLTTPFFAVSCAFCFLFPAPLSDPFEGPAGPGFSCPPPSQATFSPPLASLFPISTGHVLDLDDESPHPF